MRSVAIVSFAQAPAEQPPGQTETLMLLPTITRALDGIHLDAGIALDLDLSPQAKDAAALLAALVKRRGIAPAAPSIQFGFDPIGATEPMIQ